jgi:hypothetical protein
MDASGVFFSAYKRVAHQRNAHRFAAAFLAIAFRRAAESFLARARPPFDAPNLPSITAAGFLAFLRG